MSSFPSWHSSSWLGGEELQLGDAHELNWMVGVPDPEIAFEHGRTWRLQSDPSRLTLVEYSRRVDGNRVDTIRKAKDQRKGMERWVLAIC